MAIDTKAPLCALTILAVRNECIDASQVQNNVRHLERSQNVLAVLVTL